jgi:hypothetical protein
LFSHPIDESPRWCYNRNQSEVRVPDALQCLIGLSVGLLGGLAIGIFIGIKLYWKTGHW